MYEADYPGIKDQRGRTENDPYVPIDLIKVASRLNCKSELLFGRLYYHLDQKYRYKKDSGSSVPLFDLEIGSKRHAIHFSYLAAILAGLENEHHRQAWSLRISIIALVLSVIALLLNTLPKVL
jgi:hypothetical protein